MPASKSEALDYVNTVIKQNTYQVVEKNLDKPWGAYIRLSNKNAEQFIDNYFLDIKSQFETFDNLSPKFLIVAPGKRLSWQYHFRRAELWKVLQGPVAVKISIDDNEPDDFTIKQRGELVQFAKLIRHRLIGLDNWGIVAEIWKHTSPSEPSDEEDIIRLADDYGR